MKKKNYQSCLKTYQFCLKLKKKVPELLEFGHFLAHRELSSQGDSPPVRSL